MSIPVWIFLFMLAVVSSGAMVGCATFRGPRPELIFLYLSTTILWTVVAWYFPYGVEVCL